jgi:polyhydroxyalkanoate synthesis regulator phasin
MSRKLKNRVDKYYRKGHVQWLLLGLTGALMLCLFVSIAAGFVGPRQANLSVSDTPTVSLNGSTGVSVVQKKYNAKHQLLRMDLLISDSDTAGELSAQGIKDMANLKVSGRAGTIGAHAKPLVTTVRMVAADYYVAYVRNVPNNFGALRLTLTLTLKNKLLENTIVADGKAMSVAIDTQQKGVGKDDRLMIQPDTKLATEYADYRIKDWQKQIRELAEKNVALDADAAQNKKLIKKLRAQIETQTSADQTETQNQIDTYEDDTTQDKTKISANNDQIRSLKERIAKLESTDQQD